MRAAGTLRLAEAPMFPWKPWDKIIQNYLQDIMFVEITSWAAADARRAPLILGKASGAKRIAAGGRMPRIQCMVKGCTLNYTKKWLYYTPATVVCRVGQTRARIRLRQPGTDPAGSAHCRLRGPREIYTNEAWKSTHLSQERSIRHLPGAAQPPGFSGLAAGGG